MRKSWMAAAAVALLGLGWTAGTVFSQDMGGEDPAGGGSAEDMQAWMEYMTPGKGHERLAAQTGTWTAKGSLWMAPEMPPAELEGEAVFEMVLGGRFQKQTFKGTFMGMPMEGLGFTGFDNALKMYQGTWMDSMSTGTSYSEGAGDGTAKSFTTSGLMTDPAGERSRVRTTVTDKDADSFLMEMHLVPKEEGAPEVKLMEIHYTRKKAK